MNQNLSTWGGFMFVFTSFDWPWLTTVVLRLIIAFILGALVGYEREQASRPAGFRTHTLVCVGAALVILTSEYMLRSYRPDITFDPTRMGAQVISGIGFLGAGTIIRTGASVRGLTTAASLWAVACIGLAAGSGFYGGAVIATVLAVIILTGLKKFEKRLSEKRGNTNLQIVIKYYSHDVTHILALSDEMGLIVRKLQLLPPEEDEHDDEHIHLRLSLNKIKPEQLIELTRRIYEMPTVIRVVHD